MYVFGRCWLPFIPSLILSVLGGGGSDVLLFVRHGIFRRRKVGSRTFSFTANRRVVATMQ